MKRPLTNSQPPSRSPLALCDNTSARVFSEATRPIETEREARARRFTGGEVDGPSRNLARLVDRMADGYIRNLDVMMIYRLDRFGRGGHHTPFTNVGFPGVRIMETHEHYDRQHQDLRTERQPEQDAPIQIGARAIYEEPRSNKDGSDGSNGPLSILTCEYASPKVCKSRRASHRAKQDRYDTCVCDVVEPSHGGPPRLKPEASPR